VTKTKQSEPTKSGNAATAHAATQTASAPTLAPWVATPSDADPDAGPVHGRTDGGKKSADRKEVAPSPPTVADVTPVNVDPTIPADVVVAATAVADAKSPTPLLDSAKTSDDPTATTGTTTRYDRTPEPQVPRPAGHREFGIGRTATADDGLGLSQADRLRVVQRVARAVQTAQDRGGDLKLRLSPPELGSLRLQVKLTDGVLSARIEADNPAAKQVLVDNLPALRERLAEQNIRVERFDVDLSNSGGGGASQMPQQQFDDAGQRNNRSIAGPATAQSGVVANEADPRSTVSVQDDGRLNVVV
jgi:flagellar hook-length control protein FliK